MSRASQKFSLGIDIGGSSVKFAVLGGSNRKVLYRGHIKTPPSRGALLDLLAHNTREIEQRFRAKFPRIGVASAGAIDKNRTKIIFSPNIRYFKNYPLPKLLSPRVGAHVELHNDANAFTYAEAMAGAGRGAKRVFGMTLGTGVGGGLVVDGAVDNGAHGGAGEIGHATVVVYGHPCTCGGRGHLEEYFSTRGFLRLGGAFPDILAARARKGNKKAKAVYGRMAEYLAAGIAIVANVWDPEVIVLGGGISEEGDLFVARATRLAKKEIMSPAVAASLTVRRARLGEYGGAIGAALLAKNQ